MSALLASNATAKHFSNILFKSENYQQLRLAVLFFLLLLILLLTNSFQT